MKNYGKISLFILILCASFSLSTFAVDTTNLLEFNNTFNSILTESKSEVPVISSFIDENNEEAFGVIEGLVLPQNGIKLTKDKITYDVNSAIKLYLLKEQDVLKAYKDNTSFAKSMGDVFSWQVPVKENGEIVATLSVIENSDGKYKFDGGSGVNNVVTNDTKIFDIDNAKALFSQALLGKANDVKYISLGNAKTKVILVVTDNGEYILPYGARPDFTDIANGKVYKADEIINILTKKAEENAKYLADNKNLNTGLMFTSSVVKYTAPTNNIILILVISFIFLILVSSLALLLRKKYLKKHLTK